MNDKKVCLVTGGAGFIGSHLCDSLLAAGYRVIAIDNCITGSEKNIKDAQKNADFTFIKQDILDPIADLPQLDFVFHLASPASPIGYQTYPKETALVNSTGTMNMLDIAKKYDARLLYTSTSEVYGDPLEHPQKETYWGNVNPVGPRSCYDESKRYGEMMCKVYEDKYGMDVRIVRIFNTFGPRLSKTDGRVVSNFINQAIDEDPITVYGDGSQTRSFCYVSDLVRGIFSMMFLQEAAGEIINLGNPDEYTMIQLAEKVKSLTQTSSEIVFKDRPVDDPSQRKPDITKAENILSWKPEVSLEEGLKKTISYYHSLK